MVVSVVCISFFASAREVRAEASNHSLEVIRIREEQPARVASRSFSSHISHTDTSQKSSQNKTTRVSDLLPKDIYEKLGTADKTEPLHVEPWVPGKGAVGVRVEVTW